MTMSPPRRPRALFLRIGAALAVVLMLSGCAITDEVGSWFTSSARNPISKAWRISVMSLDESLKPDATLAATPIVLPPPFRNPDWPQPGGYASNAMFHLSAQGRLHEVWKTDAGKGSDVDSRLTAPPVIADNMIFALDSEAHIYVFRTSDGSALWDRRLAPKNGTDMPTLWGLLGKPNTIRTTTGMGGGVAYDQGRIYITSASAWSSPWRRARGTNCGAHDPGRASHQCPHRQWRTGVRVHP